MGIPDMDVSTAPVKKRQRLSLKAVRQKTGNATQSPAATDASNNAQKPSPKPESESSASSTTISSSTTSSSSLTTDTSSSSTTDTSSTIVSSNSSKVDMRVPAVASLENLGNTCFMNSVMQILRYTPGFLHNLAILYQDIQSSEKIKRKNKTDEDLVSFADDINKKCCKVVKNVYKVYRDLSILEEKFEEVASDDVMSMAVKPNKILSAIRELNPMYEGHMQHDAQEFLRSFLCYFQDAEKEVQKFYSEFPHSFSPKINPIMQRFLAISKSSQETKDKIVKIVNEITESNDKECSEKVSETEKVKVNLFPKAETKSETAKSPQKVQRVPSVGDTACMVDEVNKKVAHIGASTEPPTPSLEEVINVGLKEAGVTKLPESSELGENTESERAGTIGKQNRVKSLARKSRRMKPYDKNEKISSQNQDKSEKMIKQKKGRKTKGKENCDLDDQYSKSCDIKNEPEGSAITPMQSENESSCNENPVLIISKSDTAIDIKEQKVEESKTYLDVFSQYLASLPEEDTDSVEMQSDSDSEDNIVIKKLKEKQLRNTPRKSPRKTASEMSRANPRKLETSKLALSSTSKSESSVLTVKHQLDFSEKSCPDRRKETVSDIEKGTVDDIPTTSVSHPNVKSEVAEDGDDTKRGVSVLDNNPEGNGEQKPETLSVPIALVPVVKLENCDHVLNENGTFVSAAYATKCLTPMKNDRRSSTGSGNYLKQRSQPYDMDINDEEQFKKALAEMLNSPVKSRSKYDLIERTFQGSMMLRTRCLQCESSTERQEDFHDVSVPVRIEKADSDDEDEDENKCDLLDLIEASTEVEKLLEENKYYCDECKAYVEAERSMHYDVMPDILTMHLKRFSSETKNPSNITKINDHVDIPLALPCLRYKCSQSCLRPDHRYKLYGVVTHSGVTLTSGHYLAYVRSLPHQQTDKIDVKQQTLPVNTDYKHPPAQPIATSINKSDKPMPATRRKMGVATKLPSRFDDSVIANTKVKAFQSVAVKKMKPDPVATLLPNKQFDGEWFECDDETVRVFDESDFVELLSEKSGSLLGTPYLLFYHKDTVC